MTTLQLTLAYLFISKKFTYFFCFILLTLSLSGCSTLGYLFQAGKGQLEIIQRSKPIENVLKDEKTPPKTKQILSEISKIKKFTEDKHLKPTRNYTEYVKLDRPVAVWVVGACDPLEFKPKEWSFLIIGSVPYLGFFNLEKARSFAEELRSQGYDVNLRGARAYSTIGWFKDPILSSMIPEKASVAESRGEVVDVVIHESVHATVYIEDQSIFNESLASFVALKLTQEYLEKNYGVDSEELKNYLKQKKRSEEYGSLMHKTYQILDQIYQDASLSKEQKLTLKQKHIEALVKELNEKFNIFEKEINNAVLQEFKTYYTNQDDFEVVFKKVGSNWDEFFKKIATLNEKSFPQKQTADFSAVLKGL